MATTQEVLDALGITPAQHVALQKIGSAVADLDAASVAGGNAGFSVAGLAAGIAISGLDAQITAYRETVAAGRAQAVTDNEAAQEALQADHARIAVIDALEAPTPEEIAEAAGLRAKIKRVGAECVARTEGAEAFAQSVAPIVAGLEARLRRLATGDMTAV